VASYLPREIWIGLWYLSAGVAALCASCGNLAAQSYPSQDIHYVVGYPPGSGADVLVRFFAEKLRPLSGQNVVIDNKPGAQNAIATEYVARAKPDGYTLLSAGSGAASAMHLLAKPPVDVTKAFQVAATMGRQGFMVLVDARKPIHNMAELTAAMKAKGSAGSYASAAPNGTVVGEFYKKSAGLETVEVNYRTSNDTINDMMSGAVDFAVLDPVVSLAQQRNGKMRILAISTGERLQAMPDIPTLMEQGIPLDLTGWTAVTVPAATPRPIVDKLNEWFRKIVSTPEARTFLHGAGSDPFMTSPDEAQALLVKTSKDWGELIKIANIKPQG